MVIVLVTALLGLQAEGVEGWIGRLGSDDVAVRERASAALRGLGREALPALGRALDSPDAEVRGRASDLLRALSGGSPGVRLFRLRNADPSEVAALLRAVFDGVDGFDASADLRTRTVIVSWSRDACREEVETIVVELDRDPGEPAVRGGGGCLPAAELARRLELLLRGPRSR
jgi:hypothetical protein